MPNIIKLLCFFMCLGLGSEKLFADIPLSLGADIKTETAQRWQSAFVKKAPLLKEIHAELEIDQYYLNALILEDSPYLLRHATNPVNWQPWNASVFQQANNENKLIFLSIGYSTCFWCHTMEEESFLNEEIAALLGEHYLSVKVDREQTPDIDQYYTAALQAITGSAGWPITAILNAQGDPLFIKAYMSAEQLKVMLPKLEKQWQLDPSRLNANAKRLANLVDQQFSSDISTIGQSWGASELEKTVDALKLQLDDQQGGFKGTQKFPSEGMLLFALNWLQHNEDQMLADIIQKQLDNMLARGLYDHIHGGFHRYSTDSNWMIPHYEKMLYNQGQLLSVYALAYRIFSKSKYKEAILDIATFSEKNMYVPKEGFYSAIDAVFKGQDGGYYLWTKEFFTMLEANLETINTYDFLDPHSEKLLKGVYFKQILDDKNSVFRVKMANMKSALGKPLLDKKVISAWNALMISGLVDAFQSTQIKSLKRLAINAAETVWQRHYLEKEALLVRSSLNGSVNALNPLAGQLSDYAYFSQSMLKLYELTQDERWLVRSQKLVAIAFEHFSDNSGGFYMQDGRVPKRLKRWSSFQDNELISANAVMAQVLQQLNTYGADSSSNRIAKNSIQTLKSQFSVAPLNHLYAGKVLTDHQYKSLEKIQFFAQGNGRVALSGCLQAGVNLKVELEAGWHVNSVNPKQDYLLATNLKMADDDQWRIIYPQSKMTNLGFNDELLSLYQGDFIINAQPKKTEFSSMQKIELAIQACSDNICLLPERLKFLVQSTCD